MVDKRENAAYWTLRIALGALALLAGLDKFTNLLASWDMYLSPLAVRLLPVSPAAFLRIAGVVEMAVGAAILLGQARIAGWVAAAWLLGISLNLVSSGQFLDVAARDLVLSASATALARLAQDVEARSPAPHGERPEHAGAHV
jgi:uncharacterized membrane protein YphA (DoxX/SURF4 family)